MKAALFLGCLPSQQSFSREEIAEDSAFHKYTAQDLPTDDFIEIIDDESWPEGLLPIVNIWDMVQSSINARGDLYQIPKLVAGIPKP